MARLQIDVTDHQLKELEALIEESRASSKKELFSNALTLLQWAVGERKKGNIIASIDDRTQKYRELVMPLLNKVVPQPRYYQEEDKSVAADEDKSTSRYNYR